MKPKDWSPRKRIEAEYRTLIHTLLEKYLNLPTHANLGQITEALVNFSTISHFFQEAAFAIASRMATQVKIENARSWKAAARQSSKGLAIYRALQGEMEGDVGQRVRELVAENAQLISSIPADIREEVNREISEAQMTGVRHEAIAEYLRKRVPQLTKIKAALIARTETGKSSTAITRARAEDLGLNWYVWETSQDQRVRASHRNLQGVLVNWNDPPQPEALVGQHSTLGRGNAADFPNCRCNALPLLDVRDVSWPRKVFHQSRIQYMTLSRFRQIAA